MAIKRTFLEVKDGNPTGNTLKLTFENSKSLDAWVAKHSSKYQMVGASKQ